MVLQPTLVMKINSMNMDRISAKNILTIAIIAEDIEIIITMIGHTIEATVIIQITISIIITTTTIIERRKVLNHIKIGVHKKEQKTLTFNQLVMVHKIITNNKNIAMIIKIKITIAIILELIWI
jgi:hypothetical protein